MRDKDTHAIYPPNDDDEDTGHATMFVVVFALSVLVLVVVCWLGATVH